MPWADIAAMFVLSVVEGGGSGAIAASFFGLARPPIGGQKPVPIFVRGAIFGAASWWPLFLVGGRIALVLFGVRYGSVYQLPIGVTVISVPVLAYQAHRGKLVSRDSLALLLGGQVYAWLTMFFRTQVDFRLLELLGLVTS